CSECLRVAGEAWTFGQKVSHGARETHGNLQVAGGTVGFFDNNGFSLAKGRLFGEADLAGGAEVAVIGSDGTDVRFPALDPIGAEVRIANRTYRVVGTMERRGAMLGGGSMDSLVVLPLTTFMPRFGARQSLNITIQARDPKRLARAQDEVVALLRSER